MKIKNDFIIRELGNQFVAFPKNGSLEEKVFIRMNGTGAWIWRLLEKGVSEAELIEAMTAAFSIPYEVAEKGARDFLNSIPQALEK